MDSFKIFGEAKLPHKNVFIALLKMEKLVIMVKN